MTRGVVLSFVVLAALHAVAQVPVPFVSNLDRFLVFARGRFEEVAPRPPRSVYAMHDQVVFVDHDGFLRMYRPEEGRQHLLERGVVSDIRATRNRIAWRLGDTLKTERDGRSVIIMDGVERYQVSDSVIVLVDTISDRLDVVWRGQVVPLADVVGGTERPQWMQGSNTVAFFNKQARKLFAFHRGQVRVLCDSTDVGIVATGGDVIAYWDGNERRFMVHVPSGERVLSEIRPASVQAGEGMVVFVDGNGRLKCYVDGKVHTVLDAVPSGYWLKDRVLIYLDEGRFKLFRPEGSVLVENYVPERWVVEGDMLVYLDINRELRAFRAGERTKVGSEPGVPTFDLFGDRIVHRNSVGATVVITAKRNYTF